jgi:uncharacterized protein YcnI
MYRKLSTILIMLAVFSVPAIASAHVIVTPSQGDIGQKLIFNVSSPNERQTAIVKLVLDIPDGVTDVIPTVKDNWTISTTNNTSTSDPEINTITWTAGAANIPVGERDDFGFSAILPAQATSVDWKAHQTYADGTVVNWDQKPAAVSGSTMTSGSMSSATEGPYSVTQVNNDLTAAPTNTVIRSSSNDRLFPVLSVLAIVASICALLAPKKQ